MQRFPISTKVQALQTIQVCDGPLTAESKIHLMNPEEFSAKFGFEYTEDLICNSELSESEQEEYQMFAAECNTDIPPEQVRERAEHPLTNLVICKLDDPVGYSLMTSESIPRNTVIGFYHGILTRVTAQSKTDADTVYAYSITQSLCVDAEKAGGLMRFMPHLPDITQSDVFIKEDLNYITFIEEEYRSRIATENTAMAGMLIDGRNYIVVYSTQDIPAFSVIGWSYGAPYFMSPTSIDPKLIFPNGTLVPETGYRYKIKPDKNISPYALYQTAIESYKNHTYIHSVKMLGNALPLFEEKFGENSTEAANCYSTLASNYRELKLFKQAILCCLKTCGIYIKLNNTEKLNPIVTKLKGCIDLFNHTPETQNELFELALMRFKNEEYKLALIVFEYIQPHFQGNSLSQCLTGIALCYEKLGDFHKAHIKQNEAMSVFTKLDNTAATISSSVYRPG